MTLQILTAPDPRLRRKAQPVVAVNDDVRKLMDDMLETMYRAKGIGLAAIQVGVPLQVIVLDVAEAGLDAPLQMANPRITSKSAETAERVEACLSVPQQSAPISRAAKVEVAYLDRTGRDRTIAAEGLLAVCLQHEIDHLDGRLYIDRLPPVKRDLMLRKARKIQKEGRDDGGRD